MDQLTGYRNALGKAGVPSERDDVRLRFYRLDKNWFSRRPDRQPEILLSMKDGTPYGGTDGEFTIYFEDRGEHGGCMRMEIFDDAMRVLANHPEVLIGLAGLCQDPSGRKGYRTPSPAEVEALLVALGVPDCTDYVEGGEPGVKPVRPMTP